MKYKIEIKWAIIFTAVALLWVVFEKNMGWYAENIANHEANSYWFAIIAIAIYVFALLDKKKHLEEGAMTWKQGFMSGLVISIIVALLTPLSQFIS